MPCWIPNMLDIFHNDKLPNCVFSLALDSYWEKNYVFENFWKFLKFFSRVWTHSLTLLIIRFLVPIKSENKSRTFSRFSTFRVSWNSGNHCRSHDWNDARRFPWLKIVSTYRSMISFNMYILRTDRTNSANVRNPRTNTGWRFGGLPFAQSRIQFWSSLPKSQLVSVHLWTCFDQFYQLGFFVEHVLYHWHQ